MQDIKHQPLSSATPRTSRTRVEDVCILEKPSETPRGNSGQVQNPETIHLQENSQTKQNATNQDSKPSRWRKIALCSSFGAILVALLAKLVLSYTSLGFDNPVYTLNTVAAHSDRVYTIRGSFDTPNCQAVKLLSRYNSMSQHVTVQKDCSFSFEQSTGSFAYGVEGLMNLIKMDDILLKDPETQTSIELGSLPVVALDAPRVDLNMIVLDIQGQTPVGKFLVSLINRFNGEPVMTYNGASGKASMTFPAGYYTVLVSAEGYNTAFLDFTAVLSGKPATVFMIPTSLGTNSVMITTPSGVDANYEVSFSSLLSSSCKFSQSAPQGCGYASFFTTVDPATGAKTQVVVFQSKYGLKITQTYTSSYTNKRRLQLGNLLGGLVTIGASTASGTLNAVGSITGITGFCAPKAKTSISVSVNSRIAILDSICLKGLLKIKLPKLFTLESTCQKSLDLDSEFYTNVELNSYLFNWGVLNSAIAKGKFKAKADIDLINQCIGNGTNGTNSTNNTTSGNNTSSGNNSTTGNNTTSGNNTSSGNNTTTGNNTTGNNTSTGNDTNPANNTTTGNNSTTENNTTAGNNSTHDNGTNGSNSSGNQSDNNSTGQNNTSGNNTTTGNETNNTTNGTEGTGNNTNQTESNNTTNANDSTNNTTTGNNTTSNNTSTGNDTANNTSTTNETTNNTSTTNETTNTTNNSTSTSNDSTNNNSTSTGNET